MEVRGQKIREWTECANGEIYSCRTVRRCQRSSLLLISVVGEVVRVCLCRCVSLKNTHSICNSPLTARGGIAEVKDVRAGLRRECVSHLAANLFARSISIGARPLRLSLSLSLSLALSRRRLSPARLLHVPPCTLPSISDPPPCSGARAPSQPSLRLGPHQSRASPQTTLATLNSSTLPLAPNYPFPCPPSSSPAPQLLPPSITHPTHALPV